MLDHKKISLIHVAKNKLGLDEATYRACLQNHGGVSSSKELTAQGFKKLMDHFMVCGFARATSRSPLQKTAYQKYLEKWQALGTRPGMASAQQLAMIEAVWDTLAGYWNRDGNGDRSKALQGFIKKRFDSVDHLRFLARDEAYKITEALKSIQRRGQGSGARGQNKNPETQPPNPET